MFELILSFISITINHHREFLLGTLRRILFLMILVMGKNMFFEVYFLRIKRMEHFHPFRRERISVIETIFREIDVIVVVEVEVFGVLLGRVLH